METIVIFNDFANTHRSFQEYGEAQPDYEQLLHYLSQGRRRIEAHAYVPLDPRAPTAMDNTIESLWYSGWLVHSKLGSIAGDSHKCNFDVEMTMELMRTAEQIRPDTIVLLSGDKDFVPVVLELRRRGIRVEIAAFSDYNAARELILKSSEFIELSRYLEMVTGTEYEEEEEMAAT